MGAKACIHPGQVSVVNEVLTPSPAEVASATEVVALYAAAITEGTAVAVLNGKMIDLPLVLKAERTLSMAGAMNAR
jgi:citrate lyase subunit beta/citryl-CoA lyase